MRPALQFVRRAEFSLALALCACASAPPQPSAPGFTRSIYAFTVTDEKGQAYTHPFLGGFDVPRPQFIDIDADGDFDLFVQERSNALMFFENTGTAREARYTWRTDKYQDLDINEWNRFVDLDRDGDADLLAEQPFSYIKFFRNAGTRQQADFQLATDSMRDSDGQPIFADRQNIPNITDLDCDGRYDLFLGRVEGTLTRYEQTATTSFGFVTDRFEGIEIIAQIGSLHGANTMYWADYDKDGDEDLFWGDFFESGVLLIPNVGSSCTAPNLRVDPQPVLVDGVKLETSGYNVPALVDIDGDADLDMFVGVLGGAYNPNKTAADNFYQLERVGNEYQLRSTRYLNGIDVGSESVPAVADLNGDGLLDLMIGNKLDPRHQGSARLYIFHNTGSAQRPAFQLSDTLALAAAFHYAPALGDIDDDGDADMLLGTWNDGVQVYRNQGTRAEMRLVQDTASTIRFARGSNYTPALVDIDRDGDLDVLVGESSGELNFVRNTGTAAAPAFTIESEQYQQLDAERRSHPALTDLDGDGDYDLISSNEAGGAVYYRNDGSPQEPRFVAGTAFSLALPPLGAPVFVDINGDGKADLFTGSISGGVTYWQREPGQ